MSLYEAVRLPVALLPIKAAGSSCPSNLASVLIVAKSMAGLVSKSDCRSDFLRSKIFQPVSAKIRLAQMRGSLPPLPEDGRGHS